MAAAVIWAFAGSSTQAFHSGGVAECGGCHSMHSPAAGGSRLLIESDPSSTCLSCHMRDTDTGPSSYHVATVDASLGAGQAPLQRGPGGDFGWLHKSYTFSNHGTNTTETGDTHGHNIVSAAFGYTADPDNPVAPGGSFPASDLHCTSCHDPHARVVRLANGSYTTASNGGTVLGSGSYTNSPVPVAAGESVGVYRLLKGLNDVTPYGTFVGVPIAVAPSTYNRTEASAQTRIAYGSQGINTWGNWCATCHPAMHSLNGYVHPIDQSFGSGLAANYNAYVKTGDMSGGSGAAAYTTLVPFAENTGTIATLVSHAKNDDSYLQGPGDSDKVMCLSCHRAHASGWMEMLRWNNESEFMIYNSLYPGTDNAASSYARGRLAAETQAAYYDRPVTAFAAYQRVLCNKCHAKD